MDVIKLGVEGMSCGGCENSVQNAVAKVSGVREVKADHQAAQVEISASGTLDMDEIRKAIADAGFSVTSG